MEMLMQENGVMMWRNGWGNNELEYYTSGLNDSSKMEC
jgi:hypothetical protein